MPAVAPVAVRTDARRRLHLVSLVLVFTLALSPASHAFAGPLPPAAQSAPAPAPAAVEAARPAPALYSVLKGLNPLAVQAAYAAPSKEPAHASPPSEGPAQGGAQPASKPSLVSRIKALWSSVFQASEASAAPAEGTPDGPVPHAAAEITENRTPFSCEYRLADGSIRAQYSSMPLNYIDPATGRLEPVDTALERREGEGTAPAAWVNAANAFVITLPASLSEVPVAIEASGTSVSMRPVSSARSGGAHASEGAVSARPDGARTVSYPQAFIGSTLEYGSTPRGLKETIVLNRAPSNGEHIWSFTLGFDGIVPALQEDGSVTFTKTGTDDTVFVIPTPYMEDSARPKARGSFSTAVRYELTGITPSGCTLSVVADEGWLQDPARVYPCRIDPSLYFVGYQADPWEVLSTTVSSVPGWEDSNFSWCDYVWASDDYLSSGVTEHAYLRPPASFFTGYWVPPGYSLSEARLWLYGGYVDGPGFITAEACEGYTPPLDWLTWNGYMNGEGQVTSDHASPEADLMQGPDWNNDYGYHHALDITDMVANWQMSGDEAVRISAGPGTYAEFNAGSSACAPVWEAVYADAPLPARPEAQITSPSGSQLTTPTFEWGYYQADNIPQAAWEARVQTGAESASTVARASGDDDSNSGIPAPEPPGGFVPGTTYHARVRVAYDAGEGTNYYPYLRWSGWDEATFTVPLPLPDAPAVTLMAPSGVTSMTPTAVWGYAQAGSPPLPQSAYRLEVRTEADGGGSVVVSASAVSSDTSAPVPQPPGGLVPGTTYHVRVSAACEGNAGVPLVWGGWSGSLAFTPTSPLPVTTVVIPSDGATTTLGPVMLWGYAQADGLSQSAWEAEVTDTEGAVVASAAGTGSTITTAVPVPTGGFLHGTTYSVRVRTASHVNGNTPVWWGEWSTPHAFTPTVSAPTVQLTSPSNTASMTPFAEWGYEQAEGRWQEAWAVELAETATGTAIASVDGPGSATSASVPVPPGGLAPGATYHVRVSVACDPGTGTLVWSGWGSFTFKSPALPDVTVTSPLPGEVTEDPTLRWDYTQEDGFPQKAWEAEVATAPAGVAIAHISGPGDATSTPVPGPPEGLVSGTAYWARVRASAYEHPSEGQFGGWDEVKFIASYPPAITLVPLSGEVTASPLLRWGYTQKDGHTQSMYEVEVSASPLFASIIASATVPSGEAFAAVPTPQGGLIPDTVYYVRVRVACDAGPEIPVSLSEWEETHFTAPRVPVINLNSPTGGVAADPVAEWEYTQEQGAPQMSYEVEVATVTGGVAVASLAGAGEATSAPVPVPEGGFYPGTTYYVRARASSYPAPQAEHFSGWEERTFIAAGASETTLTSPSGETTAIPTARWTYAHAHLPQKSYEIEVSGTPTGTAIASVFSTGSAPTARIPVPDAGFTPNTLYYVRVRTSCYTNPLMAGHWSDWTASGSFKVPNPTFVGGTVSQDTTWTVQNSPYVLTAMVTIPATATLAIESGVVVKASNSGTYGYGITALGTLAAEGTTDMPVYFTSVNDNTLGGATGSGAVAAGDWMGIRFQGSAASASSLKHAEVRYAGRPAQSPGGGVGNAYYQAALLIGGGAVPAPIESVVVTATSSTGIQVLDGAPTLTNITQSGGSTGLSLDASAAPVVTGSSFDKNTSRAVSMHSNSTPVLTDVTGKGNGWNLIYLTGTRSVAPTLTLSATTLPYYGDLVIGEGAKVAAEPGAVYKAAYLSGNSNYGAGITVLGKLAAEGTTDMPVIFTSLYDDTQKAGGPSGSGLPGAAPSDWMGVRLIGSAASGSVIKHAEIRYAGSARASTVSGQDASYSTALLIGGGNCSPSVESVLITESAGIGTQILTGCSPVLSKILQWGVPQAFAVEGTASPTVHDTDFSAVGTGYLASLDANSSPTFVNVRFVGDAGSIRGIHLHGSRTETDPLRPLDLPDLGIPYIGDLTIEPGATVVMRPGVVYKHWSSSEALRIRGKLIAQGTAERPVVLTSVHDDDFGGKTYYGRRGAPSAEQWVGVRFLGSTASSSVLEHAHIRYAGNAAYIDNGPNVQAGLVLANGANPTVSDVTVMRTAGTGLLVYSGSASKISRITQSGFNGSPGNRTTNGIRLMQGASASISASRFDGNTYGLHTDPDTSATVNNGGFRENTYGVYADTGSFVTATHSIISNNTVNGVLIFGGGGGTHSFQSCQVSANGVTGGYGASGMRVVGSGATVAVNASNLSGNGPLNGLFPGDTNLDADPIPAHSINASGNYWGLGIFPRSAEASAADVSAEQLSERLVLNTLYGEARLMADYPGTWPYPVNHFLDGGHLNYRAELASYDLEPGKTKYADLAYPASQVWNGYRPGVVREAVANDDPSSIVPIMDVSYPNVNWLGRANPNPGWPLYTGDPQIELNTVNLGGYSPAGLTSIIAHEMGHCLGLRHSDPGDLMYQYTINGHTPLSANDKASYDAAYKQY
ncbi:MAG: right-handed parallel beta-helix repeat-containing protein [Coriobacteriia bacterium]|nr:right-handed parallel beta-helix repeat-containing protein [Coriobacteriia bacterium]